MRLPCRFLPPASRSRIEYTTCETFTPRNRRTTLCRASETTQHTLTPSTTGSWNGRRRISSTRMEMRAVNSKRRTCYSSPIYGSLCKCEHPLCRAPDVTSLRGVLCSIADFIVAISHRSTRILRAHTWVVRIHLECTTPTIHVSRGIPHCAGSGRTR
jgi:hypothetical protein